MSVGGLYLAVGVLLDGVFIECVSNVAQLFPDDAIPVLLFVAFMQVTPVVFACIGGNLAGALYARWDQAGPLSPNRDRE